MNSLIPHIQKVPSVDGYECFGFRFLHLNQVSSIFRFFDN